MDATTIPFSINQLPYNQIALKVGLSTGIGLLVGLEREWAQKEIGVRTFATAGLFGMLVSIIGTSMIGVGLAAILLLVTFLNIHSLYRSRTLEMTTSVCLIVVFILGALVGMDHYFTAATSAIVMMMLLAWKFELERFAGALRPEEIRSAVLLGLLGVVIYPLLPNHFVDPWELLNPQQSWDIVLVIAGLGFINYVLLRMYGDRGLFYAAALGGLVNSTAAASELAASFRNRTQQMPRALAVLVLTNIAMFLRNGILLAIFALPALSSAAAPLLLMAATSAAFAWRQFMGRNTPSAPLQLASPVSLARVLKFSFLFLLLASVGTLAQRYLGSLGFLAVSLLGGLVSSASTTATAAALVASGKVAPLTAGMAVVLTSMTSSLATTPLVWQQTADRKLTKQLLTATLVAIAVGILALVVTHFIAGTYADHLSFRPPATQAVSHS